MEEKTIGLDLAELLPGIDLHDDACVTRLEKAMQEVDGIHRAYRSKGAHYGQICLHFDPTQLTDFQVHQFAQQEGEKLRKRFGHAVIPIEGMDCSDCAFVITHTLEHTQGILSLHVDYLDQHAQVEFDKRLISKNSIENHIRRLGYQVPGRGLRKFLDNNRATLLAMSGGVLLLLGWLGEHSGVFPTALVLPLYAGTYLVLGLPLLRKSMTQLFKQRRFDTDQLMVAAGLGAAVLGEFAEGALLLFLFTLGHVLEGRALDRARTAISALAELVPKVARVRRESEEQMVSIETIQLNDIVIIPPGGRIPVDGRISAGSSFVDQSSITGEAIPVEVSTDDQVFAGSVNGDGALEVRATRLSRDSTLAKIIQMVKDAQAEKSPIQRHSDQIIRYLVPTILVLDTLLILVPPIFGVPFQQSFLMAMTLLVAASPCALALGTPSAILAGIARAARGGVLIKGGAHIENLSSLKAVAFDKTGTITVGHPVVTDLRPLPTTSEGQLLALAASVEIQSAHPLAQAIVTAAGERNLDIPVTESVQSETGVGIRALSQGKLVEITKLYAETDGDLLPKTLLDEAKSLEGQGKTVIQVMVDSEPWGIIALADELRPEAPGTISSLRKLGIEKLIMISGDNQRVADHIGQSLGLDEVKAGLMPQDKLEIIKELNSGVENTAMVGDGVNDAPALAAASTGIAMGGAKTHVALETSDVVLMADDLSALPFTIELSRKTLSIIRQNFILAIGVMGALISLSIANLAGIALAIVIHESATLLVVFNALRLLRFNPKG